MTDDDVELLQQLVGHGGEQAFKLVPLALKKVLTEKQWRNHVDKDGKPFVSFEAFVDHRLWQGLESSIGDLRAHCRKSPEVDRLILQEIEEEPKTGGDHGNQHTGGKRQSDNVTLPKRGNSALYTLKRLKRDHHELFQQVLGGAMSPNEAAIEAGFRKKPTPLAQVLKLWPKLTPAERRQVCTQEKP